MYYIEFDFITRQWTCVFDKHGVKVIIGKSVSKHEMLMQLIDLCNKAAEVL